MQRVYGWYERSFTFGAFLLAFLILAVSSSTSDAAVSGIVAEDTVWSISNSPYTIDSNIQIDYGVTLTIEPGVQVLGGGIEVFGTLDVLGTYNDPVVFDEVNIGPRSTDQSLAARINISHAIISGGSLWTATGNAVYGVLDLADSVLQEIPYIYLWYPSDNCYIERNIFLDTGGISVGLSDSFVYIRNNYFEGRSSDYVIKNWASYGDSETFVENNSFVGFSGTVLTLPSNYSPSSMVAINNYWDTESELSIDNMIYDRSDDLSSSDYIDYQPFLEDHHSSTPLPEQQTITEPPFPPVLNVSTEGLTFSASWAQVSGASGYLFSYALYPYLGPERIGTFDMGAQTNLEVQLWEGASFFVAVQAYNDQGSSLFSNAVFFTVTSTDPDSVFSND